MALCTYFGLLAPSLLGTIGLVFAAVSAIFFIVFRMGWNLRLADPTMTQPQLFVAAGVVFLILILSERLFFVAVPFYSSLFVFAMLRLKRQQLIRFEIFVVVSYCAAVAIRSQAFADRVDLRVELINAALVIISTIWYTVAAGYISQLRARLRESLTTIETLATTDALTDSWNRRHIDTLLASELRQKARMRVGLCVCMIDVDHFKLVNDRFGHPAGDAVLKKIAKAVKGQLRAMDQLGRFGGEEFLVVLPGAAIEEARACAERLRLGIAELEMSPDCSEPVTISVGVAEALPEESPASLLARADRALYNAKQAGRNQVATDPDLKAPQLSAANSEPYRS